MTLRQIAERYGLTSDGVDFALSQYQIVIFEITHGLMSKLSYYAKDIIQVAQERWCDTCDLKALSGWISVKDRLPKSIINKVLVYVEHEEFVGYIGYGHYEDYHHMNTWYDLEHDEPFSARGYTVTYWMPLPEPPKEEGK